MRIGVAALCAPALCALALSLSACGGALQTPHVSEHDLAHAAAEPGFPVYWVGRSFEGLAIARFDRDPGGAYEAAYGNCTVGGQFACETPLMVVTSPDNSFVPGATATHQLTLIRGRSVLMNAGGRTLEIATGPVVISIFARTAALARSAALLMNTINQSGAPGAPLPAPQPNTHFDQVPIGEPPAPSGVPSPPPSNPQSRAQGSLDLQPTPSGANGSAPAGR